MDILFCIQVDINSMCFKELHENGIKCGIALFGETIFSLVTQERKQTVLEILKKYDDGIIITSRIDNSGARLE